MKEILLILLGAALAYFFDLMKRYSEKKSEKKNELNKLCNELISLCNKLDYYTKQWFEKFLEYHYFQQLHYRTKETSSTYLMLINKKETENLHEKIAEINIKTEYCFEEIHRLTKTNFGPDEIFLREYKIEYDNTIFNNITTDDLFQKFEEAIIEIETNIKNNYKPVIERVKTKTISLKMK